ncbi:MAG: DUF393 domain-containing protein [Verrucomicrobia bacterium]|nr:DUF393 domain-containing protein [Verrucomicrobiota bacterium]MCH8528348.1 DCC1-like thiol-disulfide oxidoreductase family protein [Kiritimatiellia bacterium]
MNREPPLVLYDGHCGLCQRSVRFLLRHERETVLTFAALTSDTGKKWLLERGVDSDVDAMVLVEADRTLTGPDAALALCDYMKPPYRWLRALRVFPAGVRRLGYRWIARRRYRWFGKTESCPLPSPDQAVRFLE